MSVLFSFPLPLLSPRELQQDVDLVSADQAREVILFRVSRGYVGGVSFDEKVRQVFYAEHFQPLLNAVRKGIDGFVACLEPFCQQVIDESDNETEKRV